jgi:hypothetical protein
MDDIARLVAIEEIKQVKAKYFRGVDTGDSALVRSILAEDCVLDYRGCCVDPVTGTDHLPQMSASVLTSRKQFADGGLRAAGIVSVHQGHNSEIEITSGTTATGIWSMTDRLHMPPGAPFSLLTGYGHYHETYELTDRWRIKTLRLTRLRVETS